MAAVNEELRRRLRRTFLGAGIPVALGAALLVGLAATGNAALGASVAILLLVLAPPFYYLLLARELRAVEPLYQTVDRLTGAVAGEEEPTPVPPNLQASVRRATARLQRIEQAVLERSEFIAYASHELRTPVTSLGVLLESLMHGALEQPAIRDQFLHDMEREVLRLQVLVNDLLDVAKYESGPEGLTREEFNLANVAADTIAGLEPLAGRRQVTIRQDVPADLPPLCGDPLAISRLLANLLTNAVKFTPAGGRVAVRARARGAELELEVSDTGAGIPAAALPHIFKRFYCVDRAHSRAQGGSGLGLAIVQQIVQAHGGDIQVRSEVGTGTTFTCRLPLDREAAPAGEAVSTSGSPPPPLR